MISVGEKLRTAREKKGLSISEVAVVTRISARFIGAIEADDLASLPGGFFYKSFVQQYATALGVDMGEFQNQLDQVFRPADSRVVEVRQSSASAPSLGTIASSSRWGWDLYRGRTLVRVGLLLLMIGACTGLYMLWNNTSQSAAAEKIARPTVTPPAPQTIEPTPQAPAPATPTTKPEPPVVTPPVAETTPKPPAPETPAPVPAPVQAGGSGALTVSSTERAWIEVRSEGKKVFVGVIEPDQPKTWQLPPGSRLLTGNAGALDLSWEGKQVGTLGPRGQVRTVVFSPGKAEIQMPAKKPDAAPDSAPKM